MSKKDAGAVAEELRLIRKAQDKLEERVTFIEERLRVLSSNEKGK